MNTRSTISTKRGVAPLRATGGQAKLALSKHLAASFQKKKRAHPENDLQAALCKKLDEYLPSGAWYSAIPGGNRSVTTTPGYRSGTPDLLILWKGRAIFIELKAKRKSATPHQRDVHQELTIAGAIVTTVRSVEAAMDFLEQLIPLRHAKK